MSHAYQVFLDELGADYTQESGRGLVGDGLGKQSFALNLRGKVNEANTGE